MTFKTMSSETQYDMMRAYKAARFDPQQDGIDAIRVDVPAQEAFAAVKKHFRPHSCPLSLYRGTNFWHWTAYHNGHYVQRPLAHK